MDRSKPIDISGERYYFYTRRYVKKDGTISENKNTIKYRVRTKSSPAEKPPFHE